MASIPSLHFISLLLILVLFGTFHATAQHLDQAQEAYENGNYRAAIDLYELALLEGTISGELYFNLGNAYYLDGQLGQALLNYLRAEVHLPRSQAIAEQIALIRGERVDGILSEVDWMVVSQGITEDYLTQVEIAWIVLGIWVLFFIVLAIRIRKGGWLVTLSVLGVVMLIAIGLLGTRIFVETQRPAAVVISETAQAMTGPDESYFELFVLYEALELRVLDERGGWLRFVLADGRQGWVRASNIEYVASQ